jgi:hypothetical protein
VRRRIERKEIERQCVAGRERRERGSKKRRARREMSREEEEGGREALPPTHCLSPSFISFFLLTTSPPSFLCIHFLTTYLPPSSQSSALPLSLLLPLLYSSPSLLFS